MTPRNTIEVSGNANDVGCASCLMGRREFLAQSAVFAAAAAALAACGGIDSSTAPSLNGTVDVTVSDHSALANVGGIAFVTAGGARLAIVRTGDASFVALSRVCPHQGELVNVNGSGFLCPGHGARFTSTGAWTGGQRTSNLHAYTTSYDASTGTLTITN